MPSALENELKLGNQNAQRYKTLADVLHNTTQTNHGCMEWRGAINKDGYAACNVGGIFHSQTLHREVMRLARGVTSPVVMHTCDNRRCINPDHLVAGTHITNMADMDAKGRRAVGERNGNAKFSNAVIVAMLSRLVNVGYRATCTEFGVSRGYLWKLKVGVSRRQHADC